MGANNGTGYPCWLRCSQCRKGRNHRDDLPGRLEATGRTKKLPGIHVGIRSTNRRIEIRCLVCGHVGWTKHMDAERLLKRKMAVVDGLEPSSAEAPLA